MAILKVPRLGHPVLRRVADAVPPEAVGSPALERLVDDMIETMHEYAGVGLAAPQVHESRRLVVLESAANARYPDKPAVPLQVFVNPVLEAIGDEREEDWEGCLSIPDLRGRVPRATRVRLRALDREGRRVEVDASGWYARILQHECDHIDGKLFVDRMRDLSTLTHLAEFARFWADPR